MAIKKISGSSAKGVKGDTDWEAVKKMSESEIKVSATLDPDAKELGPVELSKLKRKKDSKW